jgi:hypothetical protein
MTDRGWDDARLAAAFAARAEVASSTPSDLAASVLGRLASRPANTTIAFRRAAPLIGIAAAVVVAVALGVGQLSRTPPAASSSPNASNVAATTQVTASSTPTPSPAVEASVVDELLANPITVTEAIERRDNSLDDTELAVEGWAVSAGVLACPLVLERSPALDQCPNYFTWLAEQQPPDQSGSGAFSRPRGPSFNLLIQPESILQVTPVPAPVKVIALGHFDDHRATACPADQVERCRRNFIVDVIVDAAVPDSVRRVAKVEEYVAFLTTIDDAIRFAGLELGDRSIVAAFATQTKALAAYEPAVVGAPELSGVKTIWIVRWVDRDDSGRPFVRTRIVAEDGPDRLGIGSYEVTSTGLQPVAPPSATEEAFRTAPGLVSGLQVMDVQTALERQSLLVRSEVAIRGWYVPPDPRATCAGRDALIHPAEPPCSEARQWLLERSEPWPPVGTDQRPASRFLNPIVPSDVPMPVPDTWADGSPEPWPVVIVGHFNDYRITQYAGASPFIVDALVWQRGGPVSDGSSVTRLTPDVTESAEAAIARVDRELTPPDVSNRELGPPVLTWTTVVSRAQFAILEPEISEAAPEFLEARAVWIVRRLVADRWDGQDRLIVDTAYTADGGNRVWLHRADFGDADLQTTLDLHDIDSRTTLVRVFDYDQQILSVQDVTPRDQLDWRFTVHKYMANLEVARGRTDREVAIRWTFGACDPEWVVRVRKLADKSGVFIQPTTSGDDCSGDRVPRSILLVFDRPIALDSIRTTDEAVSSGG